MTLSNEYRPRYEVFIDQADEDEMREEFAQSHLDQISNSQSYPIIHIPEGYSQEQILHVQAQISTINTAQTITLHGSLEPMTLAGRVIACDPSSNNPPMGFVTSNDSASSWVQIRYEGLSPKSNCGKWNCPFDFEEHLTDLRNKRFLSNRYISYTSMLQSLITWEFFPKPNKIHGIQWNIILRFACFDFPITLKNQEIIFL